MRIVRSDNTVGIRFDMVGVGRCFIMEDKIHLKVRYTDDVIGIDRGFCGGEVRYLGCRLSNGQLVSIPTNKLVVPTSAEVKEL